MSSSSVWLTGIMAAALSVPALASRVRVTMSVDEAVIQVGESTTAHLFAHVWSDPQPDNGVYAYALNVLADVSGMVGIEAVSQLGEPDPF